MDFEEFWNILQSELKHEKEFETWNQKKKFKARLGYVNDEFVVLVTPQISQTQRGRIPHNEFKGVWSNMKNLSKDTRYKNKNGRLESFINKNNTVGNSNNLSYIIKLIQHIVQNQDMI